MCPDREILSVYFDDELDSPWKEKLEVHLASCPECRSRLEQYENSRETLTAVSASAIETARSRIWERLEPALGLRRKPEVERRFWGRYLRIPYPAAAAAGFVLLAAFALLLALRPQTTGEPQLASIDIEAAPVSNMSSLLEYLGDNSTEMVIIKIPETIFTRGGEPRVLRAADYPRSDRLK